MLLNRVPDMKHTVTAPNVWLRNALSAENAMIHGISLILPTTNITHSSSKAVQEVFNRCTIRHGLWSPHLPEVKTLWLLFVKKFKKYSTNPHTLENLTTSTIIFQKFPGKNSREFTISKIFRIYCSTGEFLLDVPKVIINTITCLATFTDCYASQDVAFNMISANSWPAVYQSCRKWFTLY